MSSMFCQLAAINFSFVLAQRFAKCDNFYSAADQIKVVNISGKLKSSRKQAAHLHFDFMVEFIG